MATDNKILTVSYGTFSCTLEGFDDPFNTMRSIAEYFRDLASEDRYFGAEPPTPDPQMLQSIAEREIERRVETQMGEKGMILRQTREEAPATAPTTADDNTTAPETSQETAPQTDVALAQTPVVDSAPATETPALATPTDAPSGSIAEKLARIRAAVANREDAPFAEDQRAEAFAAPITQAPEAAEDDIEEEDAPADVIAMDHTVEKEAIAKDAENITTPDEAVHDETGRDTDEEIVAQDVAEISESDEIAVAPDALPDTDEPDDAEIPQHDMDPNLAADIAEASAEAESEDTLDDPLSRVRASVQKVSRADYEAEIAEQQALAAAERDETPIGESAEDETGPVDEDALDAKMRDTMAAVSHTEASADAETDATSEIDLTEALRRELGKTSLPEDEEEELMRELAEVAAESLPEADATTVEAADTDIDKNDDTEMLEKLASLLGERKEDAQAPVVAETSSKQQHDNDAETSENFDTSEIFNLLGDEELNEHDDHAADDTDEDGADASAGRNIFSNADDEDVSRLLDTTEREMEKGDAPRRRSAIAHLKAAVLAKRADNDDSADDSEATEVAYREDLARVVRPARPERSKSTRRDLPPLMLVSEQRIDTPEDTPLGADITPVRPRRISSSALAMQEEQNEEFAPDAADNFAEFAETVGAEGLPELLEAAAAYSNHVKGKDTVSRPQLMRLVAEALPEETPLEERLRSFGQLLRQGKIKKIARGKFKVCEGSRFAPDDRKIG